MSELIFFRQKRRDGGVRTGIEFDEETLFDMFEPGSETADAALVWFVDIRCTGSNLPSNCDAAHKWFRDRSSVVKSELDKLATHLRAGIDADWPLRKEINSGPDLKMAIYYSAMNRITGTEMSEVFSSLANQWDNILDKLADFKPVHELNA